MYSIYDNIAKAFQNPLYAVNNGAAVRIFQEAVNDPQTYLAKAPQDYAIYYVGEYDEQTGTINAPEMPEKIIHGNEVVDEKRTTDSALAERYLKEIKQLLAPNLTEQ